MKTKIFFAAAVAALTSTVAVAGNLATTGAIYMHGDPGSYVGGGIDATWTHGVDGVLSEQNSGTNGVELNFNNGSDWTFDFYAPTYDPKTNTLSGQPLQVGMYTGATRYPFNSPTLPGLSVYGDGRGDNQSSGWFDVLDIGFNADGSLARLAVDFKQFDENTTMSGPGTYGSIRFNSNIALDLTPIPEPSTWVLMGIGMLGTAYVVRRRQA